jgi:hypothetical protein
MHQEARDGDGALADDPDETPWAIGVPSTKRTADPPDDDEADAAVAALPATALSVVVARALRFVTKDRPFVHVFPTFIVGAGPKGIVVHPWAVDDLSPEGHVVDGFKLARMLKNGGKAAHLRARSDGGIEVKSKGHRFGAGAAVESVAQPNYPAQDAYQKFNPGLFKEAAAFAGDDKIEPPEFAGVQIDAKGVTATDRCSFFSGQGGLTGIDLVVPSNAFDDISEEVWIAKDPNGNLFICIPSTNEYRMVVPYGSSLPDIRGVAERFNPGFWVEVNRKEFVTAVRSCAIVQRRQSAVRLYVFQSDEGAQLEIQAGDSSEGQFFSRIPIVLHGSPVMPGSSAAGGQSKVSVSGEYLLKLAALYPHPDRVMFGLGGDDALDIGMQPVVVATEVLKAVIQVMR